MGAKIFHPSRTGQKLRDKYDNMHGKGAAKDLPFGVIGSDSSSAIQSPNDKGSSSSEQESDDNDESKSSSAVASSDEEENEDSQ